ncbi:MAG: Cthe_2314 family HEPN domain-containing protein [Clostridia bacterium]|nr:Cthe_2314 family HEPN domain-containing protein [Clostridia bacterium]
MGKSVEWLKTKVKSISLNEKIFQIFLGEDCYVIGALSQKDGATPNIFSLATIYDSIYDIHKKVEFSFYSACACDLSESLEDYRMFGPVQKNEKTAEYYIENMAFRVGTLWDLLAQLYNELWQIKTPINKLFCTEFFHNTSQGKRGRPAAKTIYAYLVEEDEVKEETESWKGNHTYAKEYRDQMTHRNAPSISSISPFNTAIRPPAVFSLKRITEDYLQVIAFITGAVTEISSYIVEHPPFGMQEIVWD